MPATAKNTTVRVIKPARPLLRLTNNNGPQYYWLYKGKQGSLQTAAMMARLVRESTVKDSELQAWAARILVARGLDSHSPKLDILAAIFGYVKQFTYIHDPAGSFESIQSARTTIERGFGDCDDLSVLLATLLAQVGFTPRFVLARYKSASKGYDHVYVDVQLPEAEGGRVALDPSAGKRGLGWESLRSLERLTYPIFSGPVTTLGNALQAGVAGATVGLNFVPVVGPLLSMAVAPIAGLFDRTQQRTEEATRDAMRDQVYNIAAQEQAKVNACQETPAQGVANTRQAIQAMYAACDKFTKSSVAQSCRNFETQDYPGGAQEGAFTTRLKNIAASGGNCASANATGQPNASSGSAASNAGTLSGFSANLPMILLLIGGVWILTKVIK